MVHQNTWMGEPILNLPQDIIVSQEIIFKQNQIILLKLVLHGVVVFYF